MVVSTTLSDQPRKKSGMTVDALAWTYIASSVCPLLSSLLNPVLPVLMGRSNELWDFIKDDIGRVFGNFLRVDSIFGQ